MRQALRNADRALVHLLVGGALSVVGYVAVGLVLVALAASLLVIGAGMLPEAARVVRRLAGAERRRTRRWSGRPLPESYLPLDEGPLVTRVRNAVTDPGTYRDLLWLLAQIVYGLVLFYAAMALFPVAVLVDGVWCGLAGRRPVLLPLLPRLASLEAALSRALLLPSPGSVLLSERVEELAATRAGAVAAHGAELRRIERDLHDGTQAHLVALSMRIGLARRAYAHDPEAVPKLLDDAQDQAERALADLRHVVRGIHPPVLTDRGLVGAVRALAASSALQVGVVAQGMADGPGEDGGRAPAAVEAAAYFVVAEALSNAAKHSGAERATVELVRTPGTLCVRVRDEGAGGADERLGTGLLGVRRRVAALDGTVVLTSPAGGPTAMDVELPCVW